MGWTKREFVVKAFGKVGVANYVIDISPEQMQTGLSDLDSMMAKWAGDGIRLGYPLPSTPGRSRLDTPTNVPDWANEAVFYNLAIRLAPDIGQEVESQVVIIAEDGHRALMLNAVKYPRERQFQSSLPYGAGNKPWRTTREFFPEPETNTPDDMPFGPDN